LLGQWLDRLEEVMIATLMGVATLVVFAAVVHRYASGVPWLQPWTDLIDLYWAQELCIYLFVWMAKFGAAYGVRAPASMSASMSLSGGWTRRGTAA
jgi:C4-dicarboxylate transporter DctQ subunit